MDEKITIAICNYNTSDLTNGCIKSIIDNVKSFNYSIVVFDNSDKEIFVNAHNVLTIDNTHGKYINFNDVIRNFCKIPIKHSNNGSLKHCYTIQFLLNMTSTKYLLLFDSDTILKKDIDFIDDNYLTIADIQLHNEPNEKPGKSFQKPYAAKSRFLPYIQLFNLDLIRQYNVAYFDPNRMHGGLTKSGNFYDTGAAFYENICSQNIAYKRIDYHDYITHLAGQSWYCFDTEHKYH